MRRGVSDDDFGMTPSKLRYALAGKRNSTMARAALSRASSRASGKQAVIRADSVAGRWSAATLGIAVSALGFTIAFEEPSMNDPIDFAKINRAALAAFPAVLARILPGGKRVGKEIVALNPRRTDRNLGSFKINRYNGRWADFATDDKGSDPISLVAYVADVSQVEAARLLARMLGVEARGYNGPR
jgi:hypothetical protein